MKRNTPRHPKLRALARELGIPRYAAVGLLELLWHATSTLAPRGNIGILEDDHIAEEVFWEGDPRVLINALVATGWCDRCPVHRLIVHHWPDHADQVTRRKKPVVDQGFAEVQQETSEQLAESSSTNSLPYAGCPMPDAGCPMPDAGENDASASSSPHGKPGRFADTNGKLLNLLSRMDGDQSEKRAWLNDEGPVIEADVEAGRGTVKQLTIRYYRHYLKGERRHKDAAREERIRKALKAAEEKERAAAHEV